MNIKTIEEVRDRLSKGEYVLSLHAASRIIERNIPAEEIMQAGKNVEIIEDYPDDKY